MDDVLPNQSPYIPRIMQVSEQDIRKRELSFFCEFFYYFP